MNTFILQRFILISPKSALNPMKSPFFEAKKISPFSPCFSVAPSFPMVFPMDSAGSSSMTQLLETLEADPALGHIFQAGWDGWDAVGSVGSPGGASEML